MAEGEPSHKSVEEIESENEDAEDNEVGSAVYPQRRKNHKKTGGNDGEVEEASSCTRLVYA